MDLGSLPIIFVNNTLSSWNEASRILHVDISNTLILDLDFDGDTQLGDNTRSFYNPRLNSDDLIEGRLIDIILDLDSSYS